MKVPGTISSIQNTVRWRSDWLDGDVVAPCLGAPGQTKVSGDRQRETTHEICCLAAELFLSLQQSLYHSLQTVRSDLQFDEKIFIEEMFNWTINYDIEKEEVLNRQRPKRFKTSNNFI